MNSAGAAETPARDLGVIRLVVSLCASGVGSHKRQGGRGRAGPEELPPGSNGASLLTLQHVGHYPILAMTSHVGFTRTA
jgi:hypothetical protein